jgi:hypothetical protein
MKWWGYIHTNGSLQIKRYFSEADLEDALDSPFCNRLFSPVEAKDRDEAERIFFATLAKEALSK